MRSSAESLKIASKMGISTIQAYEGSQIFEASYGKRSDQQVFSP